MKPMDIPESVIAAGYVALGLSAENAKHYAEDPNSSIAHAIAGAITAWEAQRTPVPSASPLPRGITVTRPDVRRGGDPKRPVRVTVADTAYVDLSNADAARVAVELSPDLVGRGDGYSCSNGCAHCCPTHVCGTDY